MIGWALLWNNSNNTNSNEYKLMSNRIILKYWIGFLISMIGRILLRNNSNNTSSNEYKLMSNRIIL